MILLIFALGNLLLSLQTTEVRHPDGFSFRVLDGYEAVTPLPAGVEYLWRKDLKTAAGEALGVTVQTLPGTIGRDSGNVQKTRESLLRKHPGTSFEVKGLSWREFELTALEMPIEISGVGPGISMVVQVPTSPRAIQFRVVGPLARKDEVRADLVALVKSVDGRTNWIADEGRLFLFLCGGTMLLGWMIWAVYGIIWSISFKKHPERSPRPRAICLGTVSVLLMLGLGMSLVLEGMKSGTPQLGGQMLGALAAFSAATRATKLWNLKPAAIVPPPPAP